MKTRPKSNKLGLCAFLRRTSSWGVLENTASKVTNAKVTAKVGDVQATSSEVGRFALKTRTLIWTPSPEWRRRAGPIVDATRGITCKEKAAR